MSGSCADIISHNWDIDTYCQDPEWKEVMVQWKDRQLLASVREVDEDGADAENSPFLKLSLMEAVQAVRDGLEGNETVPVETGRPEEADQCGVQRRETAPQFQDSRKNKIVQEPSQC
jgi:hypothetical protein